MIILFLEDDNSNLLGLLLEGLLKNARQEKQKEQDAAEQKQQQQQNTARRPATPQKASAATASNTEKKEVTLRDLVEKKDSAGVRKFLDGRPYMVRVVKLCNFCTFVRLTTDGLFFYTLILIICLSLCKQFHFFNIIVLNNFFV